MIYTFGDLWKTLVPWLNVSLSCLVWSTIKNPLFSDFKPQSLHNYSSVTEYRSMTFDYKPNKQPSFTKPNFITWIKLIRDILAWHSLLPWNMKYKITSSSWLPCNFDGQHAQGPAPRCLTGTLSGDLWQGWKNCQLKSWKTSQSQQFYTSWFLVGDYRALERDGSFLLFGGFL